MEKCGTGIEFYRMNRGSLDRNGGQGFPGQRTASSRARPSECAWYVQGLQGLAKVLTQRMSLEGVR